MLLNLPYQDAQGAVQPRRHRHHDLTSALLVHSSLVTLMYRKMSAPYRRRTRRFRFMIESTPITEDRRFVALEQKVSDKFTDPRFSKTLKRTP